MNIAVVFPLKYCSWEEQHPRPLLRCRSKYEFIWLVGSRAMSMHVGCVSVYVAHRIYRKQYSYLVLCHSSGQIKCQSSLEVQTSVNSYAWFKHKAATRLVSHHGHFPGPSAMSGAFLHTSREPPSRL